MLFARFVLPIRHLFLFQKPGTNNLRFRIIEYVVRLDEKQVGILEHRRGKSSKRSGETRFTAVVGSGVVAVCRVRVTICCREPKNVAMTRRPSVSNKLQTKTDRVSARWKYRYRLTTNGIGVLFVRTRQRSRVCGPDCFFELR
jgi:hypothetical protein